MVNCLAGIPAGTVVTCGQIAEALGDLRAARSVATWLLQHPDVSGAHRVVRADGRSVIPDAAKRLEQEGVLSAGGRVVHPRSVGPVVADPILARLRDEQRRLASRVSEHDQTATPETLGGVDVSYDGDRAFAVAVVLESRSLETTEVSAVETEVDFPYVPTYLAFREFPPVRTALEGLHQKPEVLFVDGHGRLHPALFGFACFTGVQLGLPTIGIAKHPLAGRPVPSAGRVSDAVPIEVEGVVRGYAWAPPGASRPFYVSVGNRISLATALALAQRATRRRYPEPLLVADRISKEKKRGKNEEGNASGKPTRPRPPAQGRPGVSRFFPFLPFFPFFAKKLLLPPRWMSGDLNFWMALETDGHPQDNI